MQTYKKGSPPPPALSIFVAAPSSVSDSLQHSAVCVSRPAWSCPELHFDPQLRSHRSDPRLNGCHPTIQSNTFCEKGHLMLTCLRAHVMTLDV